MDALDRFTQDELSFMFYQRHGNTKDIDSLFKSKSGLIVYTELKYNADHDTGKFVNINRKFIKTWAGLAVHLGIKKKEEMFPVLYYFNSKKRYDPIYISSRNIMRGEQFFEQFLKTKYALIDKYLKEIGIYPEIMAMFDDIYHRVRNSTSSAQE